MTSKRLLTLFLSLCLLLSVISPAAIAVETDAEKNGSIVSGEDTKGQSNAAGTGGISNNLLASGSAAGNTLRDKLNAAWKDLTGSAGQWIAESLEGISVDLLGAALPEHIQALRKASEHYSAQDVVAAFIVLEADPTAELYDSISDVPAGTTAAMTQEQNAVIEAIEQQILDGGELNVISQFTHLTNAVVVETEFGNLESIAYMDGVKSVFLSPVYEPCETVKVNAPFTVSSTAMTSVSAVWHDLGYTGAGMTIAVLDTGLDLDHPSFAADPADPSWSSDYLQLMLDTYDLNCEELYDGTLTADKLYYSAKVPFAFNYAMGTTNVSHADGLSDHGTHVAGIAAANDLEGSGVVGMAPDAQIIVMKVFNSSTGGSNMYDLIKALEDCLTMGIDVVNMSLGSAAGFCESSVEEIDEIFRRISETDIIVDVAAGNEGTSAYGSLYGNYMNTTENVDTSTISSPSTYVNSMSIASVGNSYIYTSYFTMADGTTVFYMQSVEYLYEYIDFSLESLADQTLEYVVIDGLGEEADFYDENGVSLVDGKVAIVPRGTITFSEKSFNAQEAGAVAVMIWNNVSEDIFSFGMTTSDTDDDGNEIYPDIPVVLITLEDGQALAAAENKTIVPAADQAARYDVSGGQMSSFSCWGVAPDLSLLPDITGVGGNVYSCYDGGLYGLMSGTSMATPQVAGVTALVLQYLHDRFPDATDSEIRTLVDSLMMSTAVPVVDSDTGLEASPRQQGAGLVNALGAVTSQAYLSVEGMDRPKAELGESTEGTYSFTFSIHNFGDTAKTYTLSSSLLCEDYATDEAYPGVYFMAEQEHGLDNSAVSFTSNSVTMAAGAVASVTVTISLTEADQTWINTYFPNGNYVEGFVYLTDSDENGVDMSLPFLGFYGEWDDAPVFDTGYWYDNSFWGVGDSVEANMFFHMPFTSLGTSESDWVLGFSPYTGATYEYDSEGNPISVIYDPSNNVVSPNGDGLLDQLTDLYLSLMRNAKYVYLTFTDAEGNVLSEEALDYNSKTMYHSTYGSTVPMVYSWYYGDLYDFTDSEGNYLPDGSAVYLNISGVIAYDGAEVDSLGVTIPIYVDTVAPVLDTDNIVESTDEEGNNYITLTFTEAHPAYAVLMNASGTQLYKTYTDADMTENEDGTYSVTIDVTGRGDDFTVALCDYGCNEAYYSLSWSVSGTNNPEMDYDALYAYQVHNEYIYYYYGYDYMFGWSTIDKTSAEVTMLQSDAYEYYALNAAEYAGGYIFAVDAGYNFLYMAPGVWDRHEVCNLGVNVVDMAFDETTSTMYLVTHNSETDESGLYTIDLLTGDLTLLSSYTSRYLAPWAMTFVEGKLYCCRYNTPGLFEVDVAGQTYQLTEVKDRRNNTYYPTTSSGDQTSPVYSQSMTYSAADGVIYWAYYGEDICELITINPKTWKTSSVAFYYDQEYIGLLTLEDDGYTLPESTEITKMVLSDESLILSTGTTYTMSARLLPWNAVPADNVIWTSDDEQIATVDENGVITTVSEGVVTITATYGQLSASCVVSVVNVTGSLNAYKYYDGNYDYGYWLDIDLNTVTEEGTVNSPVDFLAADYNGHDGKIYGYDEYGQCYWFDPVSGDYGMLGNGDSTLLPADMAYDYSTGLMYAIVYDYNTWTTTLYTLSTTSGSLIKLSSVSDVFVTLACDTDGTLYGINYYGQLYKMSVRSNGRVKTDFVMQTGVAALTYAQTMCYDHNNDVLLWINPESCSVYWIDCVDNDEPFAVSLGDPSGTGVIQYTGAYVVPEEIPALSYTAVTKVEAQDMLVLTGATKAPGVTVYPSNATNQTLSDLTSSDPSVARVDKNGRIEGVGVGTAVITATVVDMNELGTESRYEVSFNVTVKKNTDNIYAHLMTDLGTYDGYFWIEIDDENPTDYSGVEYIYYNGTYMLLYAAEYVDGTIYAYGYDYNGGWNVNFHYLTIDAKTWSVTSAVDMGDNFPFVYDMAYDYTTGIMYAVAGPSDNTSDLYYINLNDGTLIECLLTEPMFMSLAIDADGTIYAMAPGELMSGQSGYYYTNAVMYTVDVDNGTYDVFMDTGYPSASLSSMAYDFDTGYIYWTGLVYNYLYGVSDSGFYLIDTADKSCTKLGKIGAAGSQVTGLMVIADEYPQLPDTVQKLIMPNTVEEMIAGDCVSLEVLVMPEGSQAQLNWSSADPSVATVDENGAVTAVAPGTTTVTVSVTNGDEVLSATCTVVVYGEDDYFITYNHTDSGFSTISRADASQVTNVTKGESDAAVTAMAMVNGYIYAFDADHNFFVTSVDDGFQRTYLGSAGIEVQEGYTKETVYNDYTHTAVYNYTFTVRDMAYDAAGDRLLALGCYGMTKDYTYHYADGTVYSGQDIFEMVDGCIIFEVDLQTGALTELLVVGGDYGESGVSMFTITDSGEAYIYSYTYDYVSRMDMETGETSPMTTFQNQGLYGSDDNDLMSMVYDSRLDRIFMLFTENGKSYMLFSYNVGTGALTLVDYVGEISNARGDYFAGLVISEQHVCNYEVTASVDATCTDDGSVTYTCSDCGETYTEIIAAPGHSYETVTEGVTCTDDGTVTHTCSVCGDTYIETVVASGHSYVSAVTAPTCTEDGYTTHTCSVCGDSYTDSVTGATGHSYETVTKDATCTDDGAVSHTCLNCGDSYSQTLKATGHADTDENGACDRCGADLSNPKDGDDTFLSAAIAAALVSMMSIAILPVVKKKLN